MLRVLRPRPLPVCRLSCSGSWSLLVLLSRLCSHFRCFSVITVIFIFLSFAFFIATILFIVVVVLVVIFLKALLPFRFCFCFLFFWSSLVVCCYHFFYHFLRCYARPPSFFLSTSHVLGKVGETHLCFIFVEFLKLSRRESKDDTYSV